MGVAEGWGPDWCFIIEDGLTDGRVGGEDDLLLPARALRILFRELTFSLTFLARYSKVIIGSSDTSKILGSL